MNKDIMKAFGLGEVVKNFEEKKCVSCKVKVDTQTFRNPISKREYEISGLCQGCQDRIFGKD